MKLAVKFYSQIDHPFNDMGNPVPSDWPAECVELQDAEVCPDGWTEMTQSEYDSYCAARQSSYDAWKASLSEESTCDNIVKGSDGTLWNLVIDNEGVITTEKVE